MPERLTVLITNLNLSGRTGTQTYVRDLALGLLECGHVPVVFSPDLGEIARELRRAAIPVVDDLESLGIVPDVIHGHHSLETMTAALRFPGTPAVFVCHDSHAWHDTPPPFPQIRQYIAVGEATRDRLVMSHAISPEKIRIVPNAVDLDRFRPERHLPDRPQRALVFSNYMRPSQLAEIRNACHARGISLDAVGERQGNQASNPETLLPGYDLVFAKGRCALEALACGASVILCDTLGCGPLVTSAEFSGMRRDNFGQRLLNSPLHADFIGGQIDRYDARDAAEVTDLVRAECGVDALIAQMLDVYRAVLSEQTSVSSEEMLAAAYQGVQWWTHHWTRMLQEACGGYGDEVRKMLEAEFERHLERSVRLKFIPRLRRSIRKKRQALTAAILSFIPGRKPPESGLSEEDARAA